MGYPQFFQVPDAGFVTPWRAFVFFCQGQEFPTLADARLGIHAEIPVVHLVEDDVGKTVQRWTPVFVPTLGICIAQVDYCGTVAVDAHRFCHDSWCLTQPFPASVYIESVIHAFQVAIYVECPQTVFT